MTLSLRLADQPICQLEPRRRVLSAWIQHVPFAMYLVDALRPVSIVELGTRNGVSYCAFCQAVVHLGIGTRCVAIDSWHGDMHTGTYGPRVLADLRAHHDSLYTGFSRLEQSTFDAAVAQFPDRSIDLLHIDGFHTYAAASHDFATWIPKVSTRGVVLFHDVAERGADFGVWRLWDELSRQYPSFAFHHGHGLGVLGTGAQIPDSVRELFELPPPEAERIRQFFHRRGQQVALRVGADLAADLPRRFATTVVQFARRRILNSAPGD